jgi:hypothetical protein
VIINQPSSFASLSEALADPKENSILQTPWPTLPGYLNLEAFGDATQAVPFARLIAEALPR